MSPTHHFERFSIYFFFLSSFLLLIREQLFQNQWVHVQIYGQKSCDSPALLFYIFHLQHIFMVGFCFLIFLFLLIPSDIQVGNVRFSETST